MELPEEETVEETPAADWQIAYDEALLLVEAAEDDYAVTPVAEFESTEICVDNGRSYVLTLVGFALPAEEGDDDAENVDGEEAPAATEYAATIDLSEVEEYPLSLRALLARVELPEEEAVEEAPAADWQIEYDDALLLVEAAEDDYVVTPVAEFESTEIRVDNGRSYVLTLVGFALPAEEAAAEEEAACPAQHFEGNNGSMQVIVDAPEGAFPEGTWMTVADVEDEQTLTDIEDTVSEDFVEVRRVHAVDITFFNADGEEIEPKVPIAVQMTVAEIEESQAAVVVHVDDAGETQIVDSGANGEAELSVEMPAGEAEPAPEGEAVSFEADSFSVYAVVVTEVIETRYIDDSGETWNISVGYGQGAGIPAGATLAVQELTGEAAQAYYAQTEEALQGRETITLARFFDITILDAEGNEVQPARPVEVRATLADASDDAVEAVHFVKDGLEVLTAQKDEETVCFDTASFSVYGIVYTVDFHWEANGKAFSYSIPGGDCASLRELLALLQIVGEDELEAFMDAIADVTFSDPELVKVLPVTEDTTVGALRDVNGIESEYSAALTDEDREAIDARELTAVDWALFSLKPFTSLESVNIAMNNGDRFIIAVTDAQITTRVMTADGTAYKITLTFGPEAEIPLDAELRATEIEQGSEDYESRMADAANNLDEANGTITFARFFDIEILKDGEKIEPAAPVQVTIAYEDALQLMEGDTLSVVHFAENEDAVNPEVITGIAVNDAGTEICFTQNSFSVTCTVVQSLQYSNPLQPEHPYVMIIHHTNGNYYVVENDCTLKKIDTSDITFESGQIKTVTLDNPIFWTYTNFGTDGASYNHGNLWHDTSAIDFDQTTSLPLPNAYKRRYINVDKDAGYEDVDNPYDGNSKTYGSLAPNPWDYAVQYNDSGHDTNNHLYHYDYSSAHSFDNYLGVREDVDGTLRICGRKPVNQAATVYFVEAQGVRNVDIRNHTVNHIDISVKASAKMVMELPYGTYRLQEVDSEGNLTGTYRDTDLEVSDGNERTIEVQIDTVPITTDDVKKASIKAYTKDTNGTRHPKDDAYRVTGYAQNARVEGGLAEDTAQVRIEGSFKVADLGPVPDGVDENAGWVCTQRLQNRIYYDVSLTKPVTFTMTIQEGGKTYVVMKDNQPYEITVDIDFATSFDFWDPANTCPGCVGIFNRDVWLQGVIPNNGLWNQQNHLDGGPGMDFRLGGEGDKHMAAIQVTKYVQGDDGTVHMLKLSEGGTSCKVNVYQNNSKRHDKTIRVGTDGVGMIYDYDVENGTYENPAKANISEVTDSVADELVDDQGNVWAYDRSRVETEYVWKNDNHPKRHISGTYYKGSNVTEFFGEEEIVGEYRSEHYPYPVSHDNGATVCNGNEFNRFLEFYIYNIYVPKTYPVKIKKVDATNTNATLAGAEFDLYGPYEAARSLDSDDTTNGRKQKVNTTAIVVQNNGIGDLGNLKSGYYYLYETHAPDGFNLLDKPVEIIVNSQRETLGYNPVTYQQEINGQTTSLSNNGGVNVVVADDGTTYYELSIVNTPGVVLPSTGGPGTTVFYITGGLMTLLALALLIARRRRRDY